MATLATVYSRLIGNSEARGAFMEGVVAPKAAPVPLRPFANEDIFFFVKRLDNSRVVRQADPRVRGACWKTIGSVGAAALLLISVLLPSAYGLLAGYQIQALKEEARRLESQQASLELQEAKL